MESDFGSYSLSHRITDSNNVGLISLAELDHNSQDAQATQFEISMVEVSNKDKVMFYISDNGLGITYIDNSISNNGSICKTEGIGKYNRGLFDTIFTTNCKTCRLISRHKEGNNNLLQCMIIRVKEMIQTNNKRISEKMNAGLISEELRRKYVDKLKEVPDGDGGWNGQCPDDLNSNGTYQQMINGSTGYTIIFEYDRENIDDIERMTESIHKYSFMFNKPVLDIKIFGKLISPISFFGDKDNYIFKINFFAKKDKQNPLLIDEKSNSTVIFKYQDKFGNINLKKKEISIINNIEIDDYHPICDLNFTIQSNQHRDQLQKIYQLKGLSCEPKDLKIPGICVNNQYYGVGKTIYPNIYTGKNSFCFLEKTDIRSCFMVMKKFEKYFGINSNKDRPEVSENKITKYVLIITKIIYEHLKILGRQSQKEVVSQDMYACGSEIISDKQALSYYNSKGLTLCNNSDKYIIFLKKYVNDKIFKLNTQDSQKKKLSIQVIDKVNVILTVYNNSLIESFKKHSKSKLFNIWFNYYIYHQLQSLKEDTLKKILQLSIKRRFKRLKKYYLNKNRLYNITKLFINNKIKKYMISWYNSTVNFYNIPYGQYSGNYHNYLGHYGNYEKGIKLGKNNMLRCKIGVTERKPKDRQKEYPNDFEMKLVLRVKHNMESEIIKELKKLKYLHFSKRSNEEFFCPIDNFRDVQKLFFNLINEYTV